MPPSHEEANRLTINEAVGATGASIQAGVVHGGVHVELPKGSIAVAQRQLPLAVSVFVDRRSHLATLDSFTSPHDEKAPKVTVSAITGAPGVGKTALAVHWAHRARSHYVDGDLYIDLRGYGPGPRVEPGQALGALLLSLQVPPDRIPPDIDGRAALYRSVLTGKRMLILVDNAASADQVRPLLPGSSACLTIVTSRNALPGLVAREGATRMVLEVLSLSESLALLRRIIGDERIDSDPEAAERLVALCAHLPLALRIAAERVTGRPHAGLAEFVAELENERERLDALEVEDDELSDIRAVFAASYHNLDPAAARLFRLAGLHPGREIGLHACAALADLTVPTTRRLLERLSRTHLLTVTETGRYRFHDLLRLYALERAEQDEAEQERELALRRLTNWYLHTADNGHRVVLPSFHTVPLPEMTGAGVPLSFTGVDEAMRWFEDERGNLVDVLQAAVERGQHDLAWRLPAVMYGFFELRGHWTQWRDIHLLGLKAARALGDDLGQACNLLGLGDANWLLKRSDEAWECYRSAVEVARRCADGWIEGFALRQLGVLLIERQRPDEALALTEQALSAFRAAGEQRGTGMALLTLGDSHRKLGQSAQAIRCHQDAVEVFRGIGDEWSTAWGLCALGETVAETGRWTESLDHYAHALATFRAFGNRRNELRALIGLAEAHAALGRIEESRDHYRVAAELIEELGDEQTADLRRRLPGHDADGPARSPLSPGGSG
ncbi:NB-ARC domain-containing protein [Marinactinospora thermotolerans DSM 45154]|uniref:NB-ARC domain-containing protein n=1 Tax=Marinactinospora thermotolerans DSM 45154 TaxID=1122192 RepID=A0A1T4TBV8_9ACTN|nr:tetratricopeptide repeat protein [Marinactinospora thermotolerans]SKA37995.1 NB-ARC domain-containing protein [Marinactinospora thermotolerans DSM 45154]